MSASDPQQDDKAPAAKSIMPPHLVLRDFLPEETVAALLDYALSRQSDFAPTQLTGNRTNPGVRKSAVTRKLGPYRAVFESKIVGLLPTLVQDLRVTPFDTDKVELELVAHNDGAFYTRHIDTRTRDRGDVNRIRVLSAVYYFNAEPKAFGGGALRLHAIGAGATNHLDIEPVRNSLLVFPSWAPHEVMPVSCPSQRFIDSRFAVNCWLHSKRADAPA